MSEENYRFTYVDTTELWKRYRHLKSKKQLTQMETEELVRLDYVTKIFKEPKKGSE
jgi:hypothetical protein